MGLEPLYVSVLAKTREGLTMSLENEIRCFVKQDIVSERVTSFLIRNVWLYFYKSICIGCRNVENDFEFFLDVSTPLPNDGYSGQHLVTPAIVREAMEEDGCEKNRVVYGKDFFDREVLLQILKTVRSFEYELEQAGFVTVTANW
jgi:hypothetical protein